MIIDGKALAQHILDNLAKRVEELKEGGITPHLAVVLIGDDESSKAYVRQKELKIHQIGAAITINRFENNFTEEQLLSLIATLNEDPTIHGIIIQRPLPEHIDNHTVTMSTVAEKDVDGFRDDSPFDPPVGLAVWRILKEIQHHKHADTSVEKWAQTQRIVLLGKGRTAGQPIMKLLREHKVPFTLIDSKTEQRKELLNHADIIISAVGKKNIVTKDDLNHNASLIGVGMFRGDDGKMHADYDEEEIENAVAYFTPVPGGVGPVNVAMLLSNLVDAASKL
ncbi:MAG: bifunctional 5,10-methylenetetrahydrofolate dehydrogenase/5,10-methenyltetrahydrofolate cyclohydrolase [Candidatus Levybacteria bacterium]|nr:bifunctional 5,10-methylenetetrahydrofolate dehydrogenase/5,10-methenyltetrahydrofolate cyclohydrolase [Candidatus Levybacteria bacterium]